MNPDYDKILEFISEHEIAIYGFGPTDYGAEEGSLLWCIKALDEVYHDDISTCSASEDKILTVMCTLIDIYENSLKPPKNNADRIHKMTDEDLAEIMQGQCACCAYQDTGCMKKKSAKTEYTNGLLRRNPNETNDP